MRKTLTTLLTLLLFSISLVATSVAGTRYHSSAYRSNYHPRSYSYSRHHYPVRGNYYNVRRHHYNSNYFWAPLGVGLLTGAVVGSIFMQPPRQHTVVYNTPPPVYVQAEPVIVQQQYIRRPPGQELVLKRVTTTPKLLNIRTGPGIENDVMGQVEEGTTLDVVGAVADWLYIKTASGQYGWVMSKYTLDFVSPVG